MKQEEQKTIDWSKHIKYDPNGPSIIKESVWSEEDEYRVEILYALCEEEMNKSSVNSTAFREMQETRNWLKYLRGRYTWKPSLSQLNALGVVAKGNAPDDIEEINSLYSDLKKLKGE